jgi:hypothetical protein
LDLKSGKDLQASETNWVEVEDEEESDDEDEEESEEEGVSCTLLLQSSELKALCSGSRSRLRNFEAPRGVHPSQLRSMHEQGHVFQTTQKGHGVFESDERPGAADILQR